MRGSRSGSPVTAGCPSTRHRSGALSQRPTALPLPASTPATPRTDSSAAPPGSTGAAPISSACSRRRNAWRNRHRRAAAPATRAGAPYGRSSCSRSQPSPHSALLKLLRRRSRYLTRDPRRLAGAAPRELVDFLADQGIAVGASATPEELHQLVRAELGGDGRRFRPGRSHTAPHCFLPEGSAAAANQRAPGAPKPPALAPAPARPGPPACAACSRSARCGRDFGRRDRGRPRGRGSGR